MPMSFLLIQLRRIGDVLMTTPAVRALRLAFPDARIAFLTEAPSDQVFRNNPHLDEILLWRRKDSPVGKLRSAWRLRKRGFDVVIDFFSNPQSGQITRITGAPRRIGFDLPGRNLFFSDRVSLELHDPYTALHKMALLEPLGVAPGPAYPEIFIAPADRDYARGLLAGLGVEEGDFLVALSPVSRRPYKVWPAAHFARLADILIERYAAKVLLQWGPGEESFADAVRLEMRHQALPTYPVPDLLQMAAMLERADLFVGNDNGPRHFAIAAGTPTVTVFGKPSPASWTPPGDPRHLTAEFDPGCKERCTHPKCGLECIREVPYREMERLTEIIVEELLKDGTPIRRPTVD